MARGGEGERLRGVARGGKGEVKRCRELICVHFCLLP